MRSVPLHLKIHDWLQRYSSFLTIGVLIVIELLANTPFAILNPTPVYLTAVVYTASVGGLRTGLVSATMVLLYAITSFSVPGQLFHYTSEDLRRVVVIALGTFAIAAMVGTLKDQLDRSVRQQQAAEAEIRRLTAED